MICVETEIELPDWVSVLYEPWRYVSMHGGRAAGAKSWTVAAYLLTEGATRPLRILCARELQVSIKDSVHRLLADLIATLPMLGYATPTDSEIRHPNGTLFLFKGLRSNISEIKSTEGIDICWVEEAQTVSDKSWETLTPTIRKDGSRILLTWNPYLESDPTYQRFVVNKPDDCADVPLTSDDNPFFPEVLRREMEYAYRTDPEAAAHTWGGQTLRVTDAQVLRGRWIVESFEPVADWHGPYYGADWGFSVDPTVLIKCWVSGRKLYIEREAYGVGVDLDDTPKLFDSVPGAKKHTVRADSARPETISHMRRHGYPLMLGVTKRPGSVDDGVEHLRSYEQIVIHPSCKHAAEEARLWSYKTDKLSGDVLPVLLDKHDHCWDAVRYALEPVIRAGKPGAPPPKPPPKKPDYRPKNKGGEDWKTV